MVERFSRCDSFLRVPLQHSLDQIPKHRIINPHYIAKVLSLWDPHLPIILARLSDRLIRPVLEEVVVS